MQSGKKSWSYLISTGISKSDIDWRYNLVYVYTLLPATLVRPHMRSHKNI